jgi:hypothetical protein
MQSIFTEFIQFAHAEINVPGWIGRMNTLCGGVVEELEPNDRRNMTLSELLAEEEEEGWGLEQVMTIHFKEMATETYWFKSWFEANYPEYEFSWDLRDDFITFLYMLSFEELMEIVDSDCLK